MSALLWRADKCGHEEPVQDDGEYALGDSEPCVHCACESCIATVVKTLAVVASGRRRRGRNVRGSVASYNRRIRAEHAKFRAGILELRPGWDRAALEKIEKSYGSPEDPGLHDILSALRVVRGLDTRFGGAS